MMVTILSLFASSCNDDEVIETSVQVTTQGFARVGQTTAFVSAYITKGTVSDNMVVGFCWSETTSPDVEDSKIDYHLQRNTMLGHILMTVAISITVMN